MQQGKLGLTACMHCIASIDRHTDDSTRYDYTHSFVFFLFHFFFQGPKVSKQLARLDRCVFIVEFEITPRVAVLPQKSPAPLVDLLHDALGNFPLFVALAGVVSNRLALCQFFPPFVSHVVKGVCTPPAEDVVLRWLLDVHTEFLFRSLRRLEFRTTIFLDYFLGKVRGRRGSRKLHKVGGRETTDKLGNIRIVVVRYNSCFLYTKKAMKRNEMK